MTGVPHRIDVHNHILPPTYVETLHKIGITTEGGVPLPHWDEERAIKLMDRQGIATAITSISTPGVYFGDVGLARELARQCNEFAAGLVRDYPGRFGALATLPLPDVEAALKELHHALDVLHLDGVVLLTNVDGHYLGDALLEPLFAELDRRAVPVFIHPTTPHGAPGPDLPPSIVDYVFDTSRATANLLINGALERYPQIPFILAHAGGAVPYLAWRLALGVEMRHMPPRDALVYAYERLTHRYGGAPLEKRAPGLAAALALLQRLYYDTALSATPYVFRSLLALVPPERVLFGTDVPWAPEILAAETVRGIAAEAALDDADRQAIEHDTALRLFPRLAHVRGDGPGEGTVPTSSSRTSKSNGVDSPTILR